MLQKSIARVIDSFRLDLFPWFEASSTIDGFQATLEAHERSHPYLTETGHIDFTKACTASVRGEFGLAHQHLLRATELFEAKREAWGEQCLQKCVLLNNALQTGKQAELHLQWRAASIDQLDIGKLVTEAKGGN
jgi:hypothetical protein